MFLLHNHSVFLPCQHCVVLLHLFKDYLLNILNIYNLSVPSDFSNHRVSCINVKVIQNLNFADKAI